MLSKSVQFAIAGAAVVAGSAINDAGAAIDTLGADSVMFVAPIDDSVATGVATVEVHGSDASGSGFAKLALDTVSLTCAVNDDINGKVLCVEVLKPRHRYIKLVRKSATANIAYGEALAILSGLDREPATGGAAGVTVTGVTPAYA